jgi:rod shape-determining protein MreC
VNAILREPPAFFNRGPSPLARFTFFALVAIAAMTADRYFGTLDSMRFAIATVVEPVKVAAAWPINRVKGLAAYLGNQQTLLAENEQLKLKVTEYAREAQLSRQLQTDQLQLQGLTNLKSKYSNVGVIGEVLYTSKTSAQTLVIDKGAASGVRAGMAVIDADGLIGQVVRVGPMTSEIALITQKEQPVPVMVTRNNLRAVTVGAGREGLLDVPYLPAAMDVREGDILVTSGIDGTYPPGLQVGTVNFVEKQGGSSFVRVTARPLAGVERNRFALVLTAAATAAQKDNVPQPDSVAQAPDKVKQSRAATLAERRRQNVGQAR